MDQDQHIALDPRVPRVLTAICRSLAGHSACVVGSSVYFYNGNVDKKREKAFWCLETDASTGKSKKAIYSTKLPSFKSFISCKENLSISKI